MVVAQAPQRLKEAEITEQDSLLLTRNLLRIAIFNISYIRGLFPDKYFNDKSVPALEMKIKKLMPLDAESRRLIDWMEKGVYDALQKKYLKTLLFCICETVEGPMIEEYAFSFSYPDTGDNDVIMNVSERGSKKQPATFKSNSTEITPDQMRSSACKMIRTLVQLMRTLDRMPEERTILMKLLYYDDVTPEDYEPPFFRCCTEVEAGNIWRKNPLKMDVGEVNSKHLVLALKVKSVLDPCEDENDGLQDGVSLDGSASDNSSFDTEVQPGRANQYVMAPVGEKHKRPDDDMVDDDDTQTQDSEQEEENSARIREWIRARHSDTFDLSDILTNFPDISVQLSEEIVATLMDEGLISKAGKGYTINREKDCNPDVAAVKDELQKLDISPRIRSGDLLYMKALSYALPMDYVTITKLQSKLGNVNQTAVRKLIDKMLEDGFVKGGSRRLGKRVVHNDLTKKKLFEVRKALESEFAATRSDDHMFKPNGANFTANARDLKEGSTYAGLHSIGSDLTRTREHSPIYQNGSARTGQTPRSKPQDGCNTPTSRAAAPIASIESGVNKDGNANGQANLKADGVSENSSQNKRSRKTSTVREPILQYLKRLKSQAVNDTLEG